MSAFFIAILILFGIILIVLEVLIVPGFIAGIIGAFFMAMGIGWAYQLYGATAGTWVGVASLTLCGFSVWMAFRTRVWQRFSLKTSLEGRTNEVDPQTVQPGDRGAAVSSLRPMGKVRVNGKYFEATTEGELLPANYPVIVVRVEPNKIVVKAA